ncbi:MAG TPA: adenosylcobinamide-GDP ribazoletransferase [Verrucomicrobiae bacterium]|nr:adenosylcobinamide-GDP ribazoletransferase [Verrucomicrobiae bacterium]
MTRPTTAAGLARRSGRQAAAAAAELGAAASFLTRLPIGRSAADSDRTGAAAFPLVGAAIGLAASVPILIVGGRLPWPAAILALLVVAVTSGGLHLDGLADTADALAAPTHDAAERARTDPRAGAAGVAAIAIDLLLAGSLLAAIASADVRLAAASLVVAAAGSRAAAPVAARVAGLRRMRRPGGLGGWFAALVTGADAAIAIGCTILVVAVATLVAGDRVAVGAAAGAVAAAIGGTAVVVRRGQLDGDGYGAIVEIAFVAILAGVAIQLPIL